MLLNTDDHLRANGHLVAGMYQASAPETALTLYGKNGKVATTDAPMRKTKDSLAASDPETRDPQSCVQLVSQLPGFKYGLGTD